MFIKLAYCKARGLHESFPPFVIQQCSLNNSLCIIKFYCHWKKARQIINWKCWILSKRKGFKWSCVLPILLHYITSINAGDINEMWWCVGTRVKISNWSSSSQKFRSKNFPNLLYIEYGWKEEGLNFIQEIQHLHNFLSLRSK